MKKTFAVIILLIILFSTNSYAQSFQKGIKAGLNIATVGGEDVKNPDPQSRTLFNAGVFATFDITDMLALQPEIIYSMKGFKVSQDFTVVGKAFNLTSTAAISYLEVPVLLKFNIPSSANNTFKWNIFAGPEVSFNLSGKAKTEVTGSATIEEDLKDLPATDFGAIIGIGADITIFDMATIFDVRYDLGLRSIDDATDVKNRVTSINIGFKF